MWKALEWVLLVSIFILAVLGLLLGGPFRSGIAEWVLICGLLVVSGLGIYRYRDEYRRWFRRKE
jgi:O-antigen/teichoic acid export membrane protein